MTKTVALVSGIAGQDGSYLAENLLSKGYEVHGIVRHSSSDNLDRIRHLLSSIELHYGDLTDFAGMTHYVKSIKPDFLYNLGAQSFVGLSFSQPENTLLTTGLAAVNLFEAVKNYSPHTRVYQASSSEMFGITNTPCQSETTPFNPVSPYACAKVLAHDMAKIYRQQGLWIACGICNNHESPRRGGMFVTSKIVRSAVKREKIQLGNLKAIRDWTYAPEVVEGMTMIMNADKPDDYVIGSGIGHSVADFLEQAFKVARLEWRDYVCLDKSQFRPIEAGPLVGDYSKIRNTLGWKPRVSFEELVAIMVKSYVNFRS